MRTLRNKFFNPTVKHRHMTFVATLTKWVLWGSIVGAIVGSTSALLINFNDFLTESREANPILLFFLPIGGIVIGYIYMYYGKGSRKGNDLVLEHIHHGQGEILLRMGPIVFLCTFITHLFGGSTGREGAAIQMGASISEAVNRLFKIDKIDRRILIISGVSGGFGSAFGTPIAGTIFGMEAIVIGKTKYEALIPCFVASFMGHYAATAWGIHHDHFIIKTVPDINTMNLIKIMGLSIVFSFISVLYSQLRHEIKTISDTYLKNLMTRAFVGGVVIIALTYLIGSRDYLGRGLPMVKRAFEGQVPTFAFLAKIIFTAITMGTGFRGGEVIPLFFMGATLGNTLAPVVGFPPSFLAAIGMVAVFCGAANTPISAFLLSMEMFEGKGITYFFMACLISFIFSGHHGIYAAQKIYEPKSRMLNLPAGKTITSIEENKKVQE
ncbi:voltage-gated chloride channel family protein [Clostridium formicaceticum]|uniref:H(+)/Cl(-) exchange transporter ClcA n=1 Tax=Clostridium formicaceticum TaxID=1497 RepID=A0AAC9RIF3_9CLOT|nr:voltage-gated chloride channel family protein [Clostridium formicaceticum]AOY77120.1 voltage-gated chloride channel protein [Clostridium formicaceticum]ARE87634.1 H(+)/Cl(-) exchange transporter ClcA [Clostridium formicaceticum]